MAVGRYGDDVGPAKYDAFISYNHAADGRLGPAVRDGLHMFARPWYRLRALRVFCDLRSISATDGLWPAVQEVLDGSRCLILLASPESARSVWVQREVARWQQVQPRRPILIGRTGGEIVWDHAAGDFDWARTTALPASLRDWFTDEPLWIDLSTARQAESLDDPVFRDAIATLAATLHGRSKDDLLGEDVRQHRRARRFRRMSWAGLSVLTVLALVAAIVAFGQRSSALDQRDTALANQLVAEASTVQVTQPGLARQLIAAAYRLKPTPQVRSAVIASGEIPQEIHTTASALAYSSDGRLLAVTRSGQAAENGLPEKISHVWLYDVATLRVVSDWSLNSHVSVSAVAFSPDGRLLAVAHGTEVRLTDVTNPRVPEHSAVLAGHAKTVSSISFAPDGRLLATGSDDGRLRLWAQSGDGAAELVAQRRVCTAEWLQSVRFARSGRFLAIGCDVGDAATLRIWDTSNPNSIKPAGKTVPGIREFDLAADGDRLVTDTASQIRVWDIGSAASLRRPRMLTVPGGVSRAGILAYGARDRVAAVSEDGLVRVWDVSEQPTMVAQLPIPNFDSRNADALTFSPDGNSIVLATPRSNAGPRGADLSGTVRIWHVADGRERRARAAVTGHSAAVSPLAVSADGHTLASSDKNTVQLADVTDPAHPAPLASIAVDGEVALAFSPDGNTVAIAREEDVRLIDITDRRNPRQVAEWSTGIPVTAAFSGDGRLLAVGTFNEQVYLFDTTQPERTEPVGYLPVVGWSVAFLPNRPVVAVSIGLSKTIELWDVSAPANAKRLSVETSHTYQISEIAVSADGGTLASVARDGTVRTWRAVADRLVRRSVIADSGDVTAVAVSPGGRRMATLGRDLTIRVYKLFAGVAVPELVFHVGNTAQTTLGFIGEHALAVGTEYGAVDIWDLNMATALRRLCTGYGEPITPQQWHRVLPDLPYRRPC